MHFIPLASVSHLGTWQTMECYAYDCMVVPGISRQNSTHHQQPRKGQNHNLRSGRYHSHSVIKLNCRESGATCTLSLSDQTLMARDHVAGGFCASCEGSRYGTQLVLTGSRNMKDDFRNDFVICKTIPLARRTQVCTMSAQEG